MEPQNPLKLDPKTQKLLAEIKEESLATYERILNGSNPLLLAAIEKATPSNIPKQRRIDYKDIDSITYIILYPNGTIFERTDYQPSMDQEPWIWEYFGIYQLGWFGIDFESFLINDVEEFNKYTLRKKISSFFSKDSYSKPGYIKQWVEKNDK